MFIKNKNILVRGIIYGFIIIGLLCAIILELFKSKANCVYVHISLFISNKFGLANGSCPCRREITNVDNADKKHLDLS